MDRVVRLKKLGELRDKLEGITPFGDPFLYFLADLLSLQLRDADPTVAIRFAEIANKPDRLPLTEDALKILNQMVDREEGTSIDPQPQFFDDNRSFFWRQLGGHTKFNEVALHIMDRVVFESSLAH